MARDPDVDVRANVAGIPCVPRDVLTRLAADGRPEVRRNAAGNLTTPEKTLSDLAQAPDVEVLWALADNPSTPYDARLVIEQHESNELHDEGAGGECIPVQMLRKLAGSGERALIGPAASAPVRPGTSPH